MGDSLNYILLDSRSTITDLGYVVPGANGELSPLLARRRGATGMSVLIYPRTSADPTPEVVQATYRSRGRITTSALAVINGGVYAGRFSAGGFGQRFDLDRDGAADLIFGEATAFSVRLDSTGRSVQVQTAVATTVTTGAGRTFHTVPFQTVRLIRG